jgi:tRNA pseudouridine55 synthase
VNICAPHGLLILDKPGGVTSRAVVNHVLPWFPSRTRVGHTGTLDPLATGVLVLCLGGATRLTEYVQRMNKTYHTVFLLGARSDTDDADGTITPVVDASPPDASRVTTCVAGFVGVIDQVPPAFSAAKLTGQRAYDLARRGEEVTLQPRSVRVYSIQVMHYAYPRLELEVHCGKGTYIRSLARDLGERLGCGMLVQRLRRTRVGPFTTEGAVTLETDAETARSRLLPAEMAVAELPRLVLGEADLKRLCQGQRVNLAAVPERIVQGAEIAVFDTTNRLAAVAAVDLDSKLVQPLKVIRSTSSER